MELLEQIRAFQPWNPQEERDRAELLLRLSSGEACTPGQRLRPSDILGLGGEPDRRQVLWRITICTAMGQACAAMSGESGPAGGGLREVREESRPRGRRAPGVAGIFSLEILPWTATRSGAHMSPPIASQRHLFAGGGPGGPGAPQARREQRRGLVRPGGGCGRLLGALVPGADL